MKEGSVFLTILLMLGLLVGGCSADDAQVRSLTARVDSLQQKLAHVYRPGIGEFMSSVQVHHEKLWFAGKAGNWDLATFELHELGEAFDGVKEFGDDTLTVQVLPMIDSAIMDLKHSVKKNDRQSFEKAFMRLTNDCNNCHRATQHAFNVIVIPTTPPFSNQQFEPQSK